MFADEIQLPSSAVANTTDLYGFRIDGAKHGFTLGQMLEEGALKARRYEHAIGVGMFGLMIGVDGWTLVRCTSRHPMGHFVLDLPAQAIETSDDALVLPRRGPGRPRKQHEELA